MNNSNPMASYKNAWHRVVVYTDRVELGIFSLSPYRIEEIKSAKVDSVLYTWGLYVELWNGKTTSRVQLNRTDAIACQQLITQLVYTASQSFPGDNVEEGSMVQLRGNDNNVSSRSIFSRGPPRVMAS